MHIWGMVCGGGGSAGGVYTHVHIWGMVHCVWKSGCSVCEHMHMWWMVYDLWGNEYVCLHMCAYILDGIWCLVCVCVNIHVHM